MRTATLADIEPIMAALLDTLAKSPAPHMKLADEASARGGVRDMILNHRIAIVGDFAIMFDVVVPWYSRLPVLFEDMILRISREHNTKVEDAIAALDLLADTYGCRHIAVGDTQIGYMRPKYEAAGYVPMGFQLLKGL